MCGRSTREYCVLPLSACLLSVCCEYLYLRTQQLRCGGTTNEGIYIRGLFSVCVHVEQQEGTVLPSSACLLPVANTSLFKEVHTAAPARRDIPVFFTNPGLRVQDLTGIRGQWNCTLWTISIIQIYTGSNPPIYGGPYLIGPNIVSKNG